MLNRDVSYQPDPTLLEEPSHVMLNHFYAQVHHHHHPDVDDPDEYHKAQGAGVNVNDNVLTLLQEIEQS